VTVAVAAASGGGGGALGLFSLLGLSLLLTIARRPIST
jgi:hypothetical protein